MTLNFDRLDELPRAELIQLGKQYGIERPERMTRVELKDELVRICITDAALRERSRGWLGVARDLVASVVEAGLHMPDAAKVIRGDAPHLDTSPRRPPVATVTLAEIYATQGHTRRALGMLEQVLQKEPDHEVARALRDQLSTQAGSAQNAGASVTVAERPVLGRPGLDLAVAPRPAPEAEPAPATRRAAAWTPSVLQAAEASSAADAAMDATGTVEIEAAPIASAAGSAATPQAIEVQPQSSSDLDLRASGASTPISESSETPAPASAPQNTPPDSLGTAEAEPVAAPESVKPSAPLLDGDEVQSAEAAGSEAHPGDVGSPSKQSGSRAEPAWLLVVRMAEKPVVVWQLGEALRTALRKNDSKAVPVIRLVGTRPSWDGALRTELDIPVEVSAGHLQVPQLSDVDYVRAALGFKLGASFRPLLLGIEAGADDGVRFRPRQMSAAMANAALEQAKVLSQA